METSVDGQAAPSFNGGRPGPTLAPCAAPAARTPRGPNTGETASHAVWSLALEPLPRGQRLLKELARIHARRVPVLARRWLKELERDGAAASPLELVAWLEIWQDVRGGLDPALRDLLQQRLQTSICNELASARDGGAGPADGLMRLVREGELPWLAGHLFPELEACAPAAAEGAESGSRTLREAGASRLVDDLHEHTDLKGMPAAQRIPVLGVWLGILVRATRTAERHGVPLWDEEDRTTLDQLIEQAAMLARPDGRLALAEAPVPDPVGLMEAALRISRWSEAPRALQALFPRRVRAARAASNGRPSRASPALIPASQSDESRVACLRTSWEAAADRIVVVHDRSDPLVELSVRGEPLICGASPLRFSTVADSEPGMFHQPFECVCWQTDEDGDYMEVLAQEDSRADSGGACRDGVRSDRQFLLSRKKGFAVMAASAHVGPAEATTLRWELPLAEGVSVAPIGGTRGLLLRTARGIEVRAYPLALPANRLHGAAGEFLVRENRLVLEQRQPGSATWMPLVFEWERLVEGEPQWSPLTVSEAGRVVPREAAAAYLLKLGPWRLYLYRSLRPTLEPRAALGFHTRYETVIARFTRRGEVEPIIMVDPNPSEAGDEEPASLGEGVS